MVQMFILVTALHPMMVCHFGVKLLNPLEILFAHALGGQFAGMTLQACYDLDESDQGFQRIGGDTGATARQKLNQPFACEKLDRFTHGGPRDAEQFGQIGIVEAFTDRKVVVQDHIAKPIDDSFVQRAGPHDRLDLPGRMLDRHNPLALSPAHRIIRMPILNAKCKR